MHATQGNLHMYHAPFLNEFPGLRKQVSEAGRWRHNMITRAAWTASSPRCLDQVQRSHVGQNSQ
jgi:hypothetical protein